MADLGCDFVNPETDDERCGRTPTELLAIGMTAPDPTKGPGHAGTFQYAHFCEEHLPEMQQRLGQAKKE